MNKNEIKNLLVKEYGYADATVDLAVDKIMNFSPVWFAAFEAYLSDGIISEFICEEYSVQRLMDEMDFAPIGAFLTMDSLMKSPETTLKMLKRGIR